MNIRKSSAAKNAACDAVVGLIDQGSFRAYGLLAIYTYDSTALGMLRLSNPAFADATDGTAYTNYIYDSTGIRDGTAALFNFLDRDSTFVWGGDVSLPGQGGTLELSSLGIRTDSTISISTGYYAVP